MNASAIERSAVIGLTFFIYIGQVGMPGSLSARPVTRRDCQFPGPNSVWPIVVADFPDGVSSDGRGPYLKGRDGVVDSRAGTEGALSFYWPGTLKNARALTVNLNKPVPGAGGTPLGIATSGDSSGLIVQRGMVGDTVQNLTDIVVGRTDTAAMLSITFHVNGRRHLLQIGPQANGHCMGGKNLVHGRGTASGTIARASQTKWIIDLPAGSVGRLFDVGDSWDHAVDKGLYYVHVHYEIGR
jgi:hypothetical protein